MASRHKKYINQLEETLAKQTKIINEETCPLCVGGVTLVKEVEVENVYLFQSMFLNLAFFRFAATSSI